MVVPPSDEVSEDVANPEDSSALFVAYDCCAESGTILSCDDELAVEESDSSSLPVQLSQLFPAESVCCKKCCTEGLSDSCRASLM